MSEPHNPLFVVRITTLGERHEIPYGTIEECLSDDGLRALFAGHLVSECCIYCGEKRIAGLPVMRWGRFREQVISNSTVILSSSASVRSSA